MARKLKELMVRQMAERFKDVPRTGCIVVGYKGLSAERAVSARMFLKSRGAEMTVIKSSLFTLAMRELGVEGIETLLDGESAVVLAEDPIQAARALKEVAQQCEAIVVRGGYADGKILDPALVQRYADIPSREVLLSQFAGLVLAPLQRVASCLAALPQKFVMALDQLRQKREQGRA